MSSGASNRQHLAVDTDTGLRGSLRRRLSASSKGSSPKSPKGFFSRSPSSRSPNRSPSPNFRGHSKSDRSSTAVPISRSADEALADSLSNLSMQGRTRPSPSPSSESSTNPFTSSRTQATRRPNFDPPPAYSAAPQNTITPFESGVAATAGDDKYSSLSTIDTVFLIDDSGSMAGGLWRQALDALSAVLPVTTHYDANGVEVYFINSPQAHTGIRTPAALIDIFHTVKPGGSTPTGAALTKILRPYVRRYCALPVGEERDSTKGMNIIVITDGAPTDDVESPIIEAAAALDKAGAPLRQVGIQFFQIGSDPEATEALQDLDDNLGVSALGQPGMRDMVDTVAWQKEGLTSDGILKVVLGAVNRRLDRKSAK